MSLEIPSNVAHVWVGFFDQLISKRDDFQAFLSQDETERVARFISDDVKRRFVLARGMLRVVLGRYLGQSPESLVFAYGKRGKPYLQASDLHFNLSHSENMVVIGLIKNRQIGVDVEHIHPLPNMATIAQDNFSPKEFMMLYELPEEDRLHAFFRCWTRKEAYIKAVGDGFALPLQDFDVTLKPDEEPKFLRIAGDDPARWSLHHLDLGADYSGAVCVNGKKPSVELIHF